MIEPLLIVAGTVVAVLLLLANGRASNRRHEEWRARNGFPPSKGHE